MKNKHSEYIRSIEQATGKTIEYLRNTPVDEQRRDREKEKGAIKYKPSDRITTHADALKAFDEAIKNK